MSGTNPTSLEDLTGSRFVLLDSIRDAGFLSGNNTGQDYGLGITDNPLFFFTTNYVPGEPTVARQFPVKFFWIGTPAGTNDATDTFNIYVADVNPDQFYPGAPPAPDGSSSDSWLVNPRLVLSVSQAKSDVINWFDANYPGGATGGVGNSNSGSNTTYGTLAGGTSAVGNISGMSSIDGQFWPVYDYVDNTVLLYFSIKTPNCNTLSIYGYKLTDTEFKSPASSSEFLGGLYAPGWVSNIQTDLSQNADLFSSHRFSILSPDPLNAFGGGSVSRTRGAVFLYAFGVLDGSTPDHGRAVVGSIVSDIHTNPLAPGINANPPVMVAEIFYTPDKLGSISVTNSVDAPTPGYTCIFNTPAQIDRRNGVTNAPVIASMLLRTLYFNPVSGISFGGEAISTVQTPQSTGRCRAQFTDLPDGKPKILYASFTPDQYLNLDYEYMDPLAISPQKQRKIRLINMQVKSSITCYTYGKKKMQIRMVTLTPSTNLSANSNILQIIGGADADPVDGFGFGVQKFVGSKYVHLDMSFSAASPAGAGDFPIAELTVENLDPYMMLNSLGHTKGTQTPLFYIDLVD